MKNKILLINVMIRFIAILQLLIGGWFWGGMLILVYDDSKSHFIWQLIFIFSYIFIQFSTIGLLRLKKWARWSSLIICPLTFGWGTDLFLYYYLNYEYLEISIPAFITYFLLCILLFFSKDSFNRLNNEPQITENWNPIYRRNLLILCLVIVLLFVLVSGYKIYIDHKISQEAKKEMLCDIQYDIPKGYFVRQDQLEKDLFLDLTLDESPRGDEARISVYLVNQSNNRDYYLVLPDPNDCGDRYSCQCPTYSSYQFRIDLNGEWQNVPTGTIYDSGVCSGLFYVKKIDAGNKVLLDTYRLYGNPDPKLKKNRSIQYRFQAYYNYESFFHGPPKFSDKYTRGDIKGKLTSQRIEFEMMGK